MANKNTHSLQVEVIKRFIGDFEGFLEQYNDHRERGRSEVRKPSDNDRRIAQRFTELKSLKQTADAFPGVSISKVLNSVARVSAWEKTK